MNNENKVVVNAATEAEASPELEAAVQNAIKPTHGIGLMVQNPVGCISQKLEVLKLNIGLYAVVVVSQFKEEEPPVQAQFLVTPQLASLLQEALTGILTNQEAYAVTAPAAANDPEAPDSPEAPLAA
jgi:hypothetical protein